jgi:hypothetical protein
MPATSTPILQLSFEEGSGAVAHDSSPNGHDANLVGVTWVTPGKIGTYAVQFSGSSSYARIPNFALGASSYTVAFWFMQTLPAINSGEGLFSWGQNIYSGGPDINVWTYSVPSAPLLNADLEDSLYGTGSTIGDENYITYPVDGNSTAIDPNGGKNPAAGDPNLIVGWHHYCLVASGAAAAGINKGATVYIDGVQKSADPNIGGNPITPATDIFLGGRYSLAANRFFNGAMDEVRLYDHALAASEVADLAGVSIANAAPTANAGPNKKIMLCTAPLINSVALAGTISDDGQPNPPATCTAAWSKLSGPPAAVTFANAAAASTTATFTSAGTYVLQLTASDSVLIGTSNVTVIILAPGDFNGDGRVDGVDFLNWQSHYPTSSGATCDHGDANGDGKVDGVDFLVWQSHYHG